MAIHPAVIKNTFLSHLVFWVFFLPLLSYIFLPLVLPDQKIDAEEMEFVTSYVSDMGKINDRTNSFFSSLFIKSGLVGATESFFTGDFLPTKVRQHSTIATAGADWAGSWIRGVWSMVYKSIWRFNAMLSIALLPTATLCIAAMIDGFATRAKKKYNFERSNQVFFYTSTHTAVFVLGMFVFLPIVPIPLTAHVIAAFMGVLATALWYATNNFQTGN